MERTSRAIAVLALAVASAPGLAAAQTSPSGPTATSTATAPFFPAPSAPVRRTPFVLESGLSLAAGLSLFLSDAPNVAAPALEVAPREARWRGGILMDEPVRERMRLSSDTGRERAATASDAILGILTLGVLAESAIAAPLANGDTDLALHASSAYALALGTTLVLGELVKLSVSRARPFERYCLDDPSSPGCGNDDSISSFYSLHTAVAFTSAGFSCAMHLGRDLFGDPLADVMACGTSIAAATAVGLLRVVADRHYLTDVIVGSLVGLGVGILVPLLVVPRRSPNAEVRTSDAGTPGLLMPLFSPGANGDLSTSTVGLSFAGTF